MVTDNKAKEYNYNYLLFICNVITEHEKKLQHNISVNSLTLY